MIITLEPNAPSEIAERIAEIAARHPSVTPKTFVFRGASETLTEIHLHGETLAVPTEQFEGISGVRQVRRVSRRYRVIGRQDPADGPLPFEHNGVRFDEQTVHVMAGLCAVDTRENVRDTMAALRSCGLVVTRMGAYKPRTSPYDFQGLGSSCLPWVFEMAGEHGIKVIAMEVTNPRHLDEIEGALAASGHATAVMAQIGTRNAQNFELLKHLGQRRDMPVLFKRGMGITLEESLHACEYIASEGNSRILFCLRGVKTHLGDPHRNLVDFGHVPVVRRLTRLPVCVDPSHSVGRGDVAPDGLPDIFHATGQGIIAGASAVLVDLHPRPETALCDGPQALTLEQLPRFVRYVARVREAYDAVRQGP